jgi:hypothetical protein
LLICQLEEKISEGGVSLIMPKKNWLKIGLLFTLAITPVLVLTGFNCETSAATEEITIDQYEVTVNENFYVPATGNNNDSFPKGFPTGYGSGLTFKSFNHDGSMEFYGLTDRGPNGDGPIYLNDGREYPTKFFPTPQFVPQIGVINIKDGQVKVVDRITIKDYNGNPISGLPLEPGQIGSSEEIPISETGYRFAYDENGLDPEGIARDQQGNFWICDEYGPFIVKLSRNGYILKKYLPGRNLPAVLKFRQPNRGFEAITIAPNGKIYVAVQSTLDINGKTKNSAQLIRIVELNPLNGATRMFAYPLDSEAYQKNSAAKIGDMCAISNNQIILVEQGNGKTGIRNILYMLDLTQATDITNLQVKGQELEFVKDLGNVKDLKLVVKQKILDLREYGWTAEKAEGLTVLNDNRTIVVVNDNDFGLTMQVSDKLNTNPTEIGKYRMNQERLFTYNGQPAQPKFKTVPLNPGDSKTVMWLIKMPINLTKLLMTPKFKKTCLIHPKRLFLK